MCVAGRVGRAGHRWVGPRVGAAGRAALVPSHPRFWVLGGGLGVWECGPIVVFGPDEGSDFLSVGGFGQSAE